MVHIKMVTLLQSMETIRQVSTIKMSAKCAYLFAKFMKKADEEFNEFQKQRDNLITDLGVKNETGVYQVTEENMATYKTQVEELGNVDVRFELDPIKIGDLGDVQIEPANMLGLQWMIEG